MGIHDDVVAMDINLLAEMFQSGDYRGLRDWVISHSKGLIPTEISEQKEAFYASRNEAIIACNEYLERSAGFYYGNVDVEQQYRSRIREAIAPLMLSTFVDEKTKRKIERSIDNRDIQRALRKTAQLRWLQIGNEDSARTSLESKFQDPINLLPELLRIVSEDFAQLRDNTQKSIASLISPLIGLNEDTNSDVRGIRDAIDSIRNNVRMSPEMKEREEDRYRTRLHDLHGIQSAVSRRLEEVTASATIARGIMANVKEFVNVIEDQLAWMKKRAEYLATLSSLGESADELQQTSEHLIENVRDEIGSIGKSVGAKSDELQGSLQKIIDDQDALNRILHTNRPTLKVEIELSETRTNDTWSSIDFDPILKMIQEIREL